VHKLHLVAGALCLSLMAGGAQAAVLFAFEETGGNVVGTLSGELDLAGAASLGTAFLADVPGLLFPPEAGLVLSPAGSGEISETYAIDAPGSFGGGPVSIATSAAGSLFTLVGAFGGNASLGLPEGYAGEALAGTITFAGASFASLGIAPGEYVYTLPNDTVTLRFGRTEVIPLPASLPLMLGALGLTLAVARRRG
jgi:hypothetical protein